MSSYSFRTSRPDHWTSPRAHRDPSLRALAYGPVRSMHEPNWFERLLGWH